jgi:hypothetical protein
VVTYLFSPALVFVSIDNAELGGGPFLRILLFVLALAACTLTLGWLAARALRVDRPTEGAILLSTTFMNVGNLGLPVTRFAFGESALAYAVVFFVVQATLSWTLGVFIAARSSTVGLRPLFSALRLPTTYAALAGALVQFSGVHLPTIVMRPAELLSGAAIATMLVVLGFQLSGGVLAQRGVVAVALRLLVSAAIAVPLTLLVGAGGTERQVMLVMAAMPTAVFTTIIASEFSSNPALVTATVVVLRG